jgi:hypothetical protein
MWLSLDIDDMAMGYGHGGEEGCVPTFGDILSQITCNNKK